MMKLSYMLYIAAVGELFRGKSAAKQAQGFGGREDIICTDRITEDMRREK